MTCSGLLQVHALFKVLVLGPRKYEQSKDIGALFRSALGGFNLCLLKECAKLSDLEVLNDE